MIIHRQIRRFGIRRFLKFGVLITGSALALAACSSSSSAPAKSTSSTSYSSTTSSPYSSSTATSQPTSSGVAIKTVHSAIGTVLVNGSGMVLYALTSATSTSSPCDTATCLGIWPPVSGSSKPSVGVGVSSAHFGTLTLPSGAKQLTYYGHPLYLFSGDSAAGQTNGEGIAFPVGAPHPSAYWYAVSASGTLVIKSSSSASTAKSSSGYSSSTGSGTGSSPSPSTGSSSSGYGASAGTGSSSSPAPTSTSSSGYGSSASSGSTSSKKSSSTSSGSSGGWNG